MFGEVRMTFQGKQFRYMSRFLLTFAQQKMIAMGLLLLLIIKVSLQLLAQW